MCLLKQEFSISGVNQLKKEHVLVNVNCFKCFICRDFSDEHRAFIVLEKKILVVCKFVEFVVEIILQKQPPEVFIKKRCS